MKKENLFSGLITLVVGFIMFYLFLPAINIHSLGFWVYLIFLIFIYAFSFFSIFSLIKKRSVK